jgi:phosphatidylglycerophosphatase A
MSRPWAIVDHVRVRSRLAWVVATWFGCGLAPVGPGTFGTLAAIPLYLLADRWGLVGVGTAAGVTTLAGVWAASVVARELGKKDPQVVVVDEVAGFLVTMLGTHASWAAVLAGFFLFRLLDITKPWPIRTVERMPSGWGIVFDDVAAGAMAAGAMALVRAGHWTA